MHLQQLHQKKLVCALIYIFVSTLVEVLVFSACSAGNSIVISSTPTSTQEITELITPQSLPRGPHEVLYLTNKSASIANVGGGFYASHPYTIFALCTGAGKLFVQATPDGGTSTFLCSQSGQLQGNHIGNAQNPPTPGNLHVQVTLDGKAVWEVSIQLQE